VSPDTIPTLPGSIPGLLRRGSPVFVARRSSWPSGVCIMPGDGNLWLVSRGLQLPRQAAPQDLALDLSDATGRVHAAWWLEAQGHDEMAHAAHVVAGGVVGLANLVMRIGTGLDMSDEQIGALRAVVLHVAGLEAPR